MQPDLSQHTSKNGRVEKETIPLSSEQVFDDSLGPTSKLAGLEEHTGLPAVSINSQNTFCTHSAHSATHSDKDSQLIAFFFVVYSSMRNLDRRNWAVFTVKRQRRSIPGYRMINILNKTCG